VLDELVHQGEHHGVGHGLSLEARTGGQGQQHAGREQVEQDRGRQQVHPHLFNLAENFPEQPDEFVVQRFHEDKYSI
jgi:hypothetical protein